MTVTVTLGKQHIIPPYLVSEENNPENLTSNKEFNNLSDKDFKEERLRLFRNAKKNKNKSQTNN